MTERIRRINYGNMETEATIEDPKSYTKPWTVRFNHRIMPDTESIEFIRGENERDAPHLAGKQRGASRIGLRHQRLSS